MENKQNVVSVKWAVLTLCFVLVVIMLSVVAASFQKDDTINSFADCKAAGGMILEKYPEECRINDLAFINEDQKPLEPASADEYVGLQEDEALEKAKQANIPARVVQRDDEPLPVTLDFVFGRYNFYIENEEVSRVEIEGQAKDSPTTGP